jgi:hypothetical protein
VEHVLWIGGPPGSGKTTIASRLARRHGLRLYSADARTWVHRDRALADGVAAAQRFEALSPTERWDQPTDDLLAMSLHLERGPMVLDDVRALPTSPIVIAEGTTVPASSVTAGEIDRTHAVWLLPTAALQHRQLGDQPLNEGQRQLYRRLREETTREAEEAEVPIEIVDGTRTLDEMTTVVEQRFATIIAAGPTANSTVARQRLLRETNLAVVNQVRGFHARPWATGDAGSVTREFACECGEPSCETMVSANVAEAAAGPIRSQGHDRTTG